LQRDRLLNEQTTQCTAKTGVTHHAVFCHFPLWHGVVRDEGAFAVDFLGVHTRLSFFKGHLAATHRSNGRVATAHYPPLNGPEYFILVSLLMSVVSATTNFVVCDVGAGWGKWLAVAHHAVLRRASVAASHNLSTLLIAVEAEPGHFAFVREHLLDNGIDPRQHRLLQRVLYSSSFDKRVTTSLIDVVANVASADNETAEEALGGDVERLRARTTVPFLVGNSDAWYGQCIAPWNNEYTQVANIATISLHDVVTLSTHVDWLQVKVTCVCCRALISQHVGVRALD
jgi:hypothetical protein